MPPRRRAPRRRHARKPARKPRHNRSKAGARSTQMAKIVETIEFQSLLPNQANFLSFKLNQFERARTIATNFRWYKPTKVTWTIEPMYNTFQAANGQAGIPYVHTLMNRCQDSSNMTLSDLLTTGTRPVKLTSMNKLTYRPNWCSPGLLAQNIIQSPSFGGYLNNVVMTGLQAQYSYLQAPNAQPPSYIRPSTQFTAAVPGEPANQGVANLPGEVRFNGHIYYVEQQNAPTIPPLFKVTCQVHWSFKDAKNTLATATDNIFASTDLSGQDIPAGGPTGPDGLKF